MHTELNDSVKALCPVLDQTMSALLSDLEERDLLDDTVVTLFSENGKAPKFDDLDKKAGKVNGTKGGRGHWGKGYSVVVAGGGFQGGKAVGTMDRNGMEVEERIIYPWDMWETIYLLLGIDPQDTLPNPYGCVAYISVAEACNLPRGGLLTEII
jgi:arylsulfatase A-like enzyme